MCRPGCNRTTPPVTRAPRHQQLAAAVRQCRQVQNENLFGAVGTAQMSQVPMQTRIHKQSILQCVRAWCDFIALFCHAELHRADKKTMRALTVSRWSCCSSRDDKPYSSVMVMMIMIPLTIYQNMCAQSPTRTRWSFSILPK